MAIVEMHINSEYFGLIASGEKRLELRINDPKRASIHVGDTIQFSCRGEEDKKLLCTVEAIHRAASFAKLVDVIPLELLGGIDPIKQMAMLTEIYIHIRNKNKVWSLFSWRISVSSENLEQTKPSGG